MNSAITAARARTLTVCVPCLTGQTHTRCDTDTAPVAERATITATTTRPQGDPDPLIPGYGASLAVGYPPI